MAGRARRARQLYRRSKPRLVFESLEDRSLLSALPLSPPLPVDSALDGQALVSAAADTATALKSVATPIQHNRLNRVDVNGDSLVTPIDALLVINQLNADYGGVGSGSNPASGTVYLDTNADGYLTSIDAMLVLDHLRSWTGEPKPGDDGAASEQPDRPAWMNLFPVSQAPTFSPEQFPITHSQQYVTGTDWGGLNEQQVFAHRVAVAGAGQSPAYEFRLGRGSQLYSLRFRDQAGRWREAIGTQGTPATGSSRNAEWVDEVLQTIIVDTELNDRSQESTKNQIHQSGTYRNIKGVPTFYSPLLDQAWLPQERTIATVVWPQQAHIPSNFKSHFLLLQQIRDLGSGVLEVTYVYHNFSQEGEKATFLASPWLPLRHSTFPYQYRSLPNGTLQRDQRNWCIESGCNSTPEAIRKSDGYFLFSSGSDANSNALAIVYGVDANQDGQTGATRFRWGTDRTATRDLTAASVQKLVGIQPGQVFYHRFYLVLNSLQNAHSMAQQLKPFVNQGFLAGSSGANPDALLALTNGKLAVSDPSQICNAAALAADAASTATHAVASSSQQSTCTQVKTLGTISQTARSGWQPLMQVVQRSTGRRIVTNDPYWLVQRHDWRNFEFSDILGWVSPATLSALASNPDPEVAGLFLLSPHKK